MSNQNKRTILFAAIAICLVIYGFNVTAQQKPQRQRFSSYTRMKMLKGFNHGAPALAFSPDSSLLATFDREEIKLWDAESGELKLAFTKTGPAGSIIFSPDGKLLAIPNGLIDAATGELKQQFWSTDYGTKAAHRLPTTNGIADTLTRRGSKGEAVPMPKNIRPEEIEEPPVASEKKEPETKEKHTEKSGVLKTIGRKYPSMSSFSSDGMFLFGFDDFGLSLWNAKTGERLQILRYRQRDRYTKNSVTFVGQPVVVSSKDNLLAAGVENGNIELSRIDAQQKNVQLIATLTGHQKPVIELAFSPNWKILASLDADGALKLWDTKKGILYCTIADKGIEAHEIQFSYDGYALATLNTDGIVKLWRVFCENPEAEYIKAFPPGSRVERFLPSDLNSAMNGIDDVENQKLVGVLGGHFGRVATIKFSPNGKILATASEDGTVILRWEE